MHSISRPFVKVMRLRPSDDIPFPKYQSTGAAGFDLHADISQAICLQPGTSTKITCGIAIELPEGYEAQVRSRSGLAVKHGVVVLGDPGTVDSDYRGEISATLINHSSQPYIISRGERVAQMVIAKAPQAILEPAADLSNTTRGTGGFGSTGK